MWLTIILAVNKTKKRNPTALSCNGVWHLAKRRERKKNKSSALDVKWLKERSYLIPIISLHPSMVPLSMSFIFLTKSNWWNEGKGWPRWVLTIHGNVGFSSCSLYVLDARWSLLYISNSGTQEQTEPKSLDLEQLVIRSFAGSGMKIWWLSMFSPSFLIAHEKRGLPWLLSVYGIVIIISVFSANKLLHIRRGIRKQDDWYWVQYGS